MKEGQNYISTCSQDSVSRIYLEAAKNANTHSLYHRNLGMHYFNASHVVIPPFPQLKNNNNKKEQYR